MIRDIIGLLADIVGIVFVWWQPDSLAWYWKLLISIVLILIAIAYVFLSRNRPIARVKDYSIENNEIMLFLDNNAYYSDNMLVSIYMKEETKTVLCAIGYVKPKPVPDTKDKTLHIHVLHPINNDAMRKIGCSAKQYKRFFVIPSVALNDLPSVKW